MKHLILTFDSSAAGNLRASGLADIVTGFAFQFIWGPFRPDAELATSLTQHDPNHPWWIFYGDHFDEIGQSEIRLTDFCERCETIELWVDPHPNAQLTLIWFLNYLRSHDNVASRLTLVQSKTLIGNNSPEKLANLKPVAIKITNDHFRLAEMAWHAYRAPNPQAWFDLLGHKLGLLPQLRRAVLELLEELPMPATGLGATEMRMLELISEGDAVPYDVFPGYRKRNKRRVFGWEVGFLLDGLAHGPAPAVSGLPEEPFREDMHRDRDFRERYKRSALSLTALGEAILSGTEDFSRHNPIHRWWGGTELTNDRLWRWDAANRVLMAP
jgi:hypothetical protein